MGIAALGAGVINAIAGGGTLITFPMLTAIGIPVVAANITSTVAMCPGYLGATGAQVPPGWRRLGGKLASRIKPATLRWCVVTLGTLVGVAYLVR